METRYFYLLRFALAVSDLIIFNFCFFLGYYLANKYGIYIDRDVYRNNVMISNLIWVVCTGVFALYAEGTVHKLEHIYRATWRSIALHCFIFIAYLFFTDNTDFSRAYLIAFYSLLAGGFILSRLTSTSLQHALTKTYDIRKAVAVLGMNQGGLKLASYLQQQSSLNFVGFLGEDRSQVNKNGELIVQSPAEQLKKAAESGIEEVFVSVDPDKMNDLADLIKEGEKQCVRLKFVPDLTALETNFRFDKMGNFTVLCARKEPLEDIENRFKKRLFDIIVSLGVIVFIFSWLYPLLAIIIKIQSPGPVLFKQLRSGRDNKPFWCYKFRSMRMNSDSDKRQASLNDDRITPIGKFMRKTSIDELPQFFNVLLGYMSVIGPRPHMLAHTEQYRQIIDKYMVRQFLKPGISGWAQVNGFRGETKEQGLMEKRVEHDIWYMENWSVMLDIKIVFYTIINVFKGEENAY
ncbi:MAG: undecaprenyl-phosphate glucose phosphotransferase [Sphingobacteriaceae bacterium]|jgi:putative colanic acid biosynthesis UDP-glucose lipid carrier transferase|nr:undecaprenyl-phosphate glucose phosphotransferase [Sphingobacteriaceae bacterium]